MNKLFSSRETVQRNSRTFLQIDHGVMSHMIDKTLRAMDRDSAKDTAFKEPKVAESGLTDAGCIRQHCVKNGLQLSGRAGDDLEHLRGRRLLLQRLGEIVRSLAQLVEQPCVLDCDDGLPGEVRDQLDRFLLSPDLADKTASIA